ncbi:hypothetical protein PPACK8108_LOCUS25074 [Phakopsora pachyrhizi]|uniref:Uncharacterized protein n=1 Tax=Phakopsora pachyrhizi TaxID=170000 RepID=A0AAV0BUG0_PHAPC|nr:hypothetical protein PPACK8108_LOCUS25074 [Phakopsora pachyrhizi]
MVTLPKGSQNAQSFINNVYKPALKPLLQSIQTDNQGNIPILMEDDTAEIHKAWSEIPPHILEDLVASMPGQMSESNQESPLVDYFPSSDVLNKFTD